MKCNSKYRPAIKRLTKWAFLGALLLLASLANGQNRQELEEKKKRKLEEIAFTQKLIDETDQEQRKNLNYLLILKKQIRNRQDLIETIEQELNLLEQNISQSRQLILAMQRDLEAIQKEYERMLLFAFKHNENFDYFMFVLASESLNQALARIRFTRYYSQARAEQIKLLEITRKSLENKVSYLENQIEEKEELVEDLSREKERLISDEKSKRSLIADLEGKEKEYRRKLREDKRIAEELDEAISNIIAAEMTKVDANSAEISDLFSKNKLKFNWPSRGVVSLPFGKQAHPTLPNVFITNNGINIRTEANADVKAVFSGKVTHVVVIPGANSAIIIKHGEYYTVYKNLIEVQVKPGEEVETGELLGRVYYDETRGAAELHFELRHRTVKLDPLKWLKSN